MYYPGNIWYHPHMLGTGLGHELCTQDERGGGKHRGGEHKPDMLNLSHSPVTVATPCSLMYCTDEITIMFKIRNPINIIIQSLVDHIVSCKTATVCFNTLDFANRVKRNNLTIRTIFRMLW